MPPIPRTFFLCATPRSGSSFLGKMLSQAEVFGEISEHLHPLNLGRARREQGHLPDSDILQVVEQVVADRRTETGLFSTKVMWEALSPILKLEAGRQEIGDSQQGLDLSPLFPDLRCAYLRREGRLRQAISLTKAKMRDHWHPDTTAGESTPDPPFDAWQIENELRVLKENDASWEAFFETHGITPLPLIFEEVIEDPQATVRKIAQFCQLDLKNTKLKNPNRPQTMGDGVNAKWENDYRELLAQAKRFEVAAPEEITAQSISAIIRLPESISIRPSTPTLVDVEIENVGPEEWPTEGGYDGRGRLALETDWPDHSEFSTARAYLLEPPSPGQCLRQKILLYPPDSIGEYDIDFRIVQIGAETGEADIPCLRSTATVRPRVTAEDEAWVRSLFDDAELHDDGWFWVAWLGYVRVDEAGFLFHEGLGWLLPRRGQAPEEGNERGYDFWTKELGWFWTAPKSFPWINRFENGGWVELDL